MPIEENEFRDLARRVGTLEGERLVFTERYNETMKRFDKGEKQNEIIMDKLDMLQARNQYEDGSDAAKKNLRKAVGALLLSALGGSGLVEIFNWLVRKH